MKITKCIMSSDDNDLYLDFWPIVSKIWKLKFGIEPILIYFGDNPEKINNDFGTVIPWKTDKALPIGIQALWVRYFYPSLEPEETFIISDIDMLPISKKYFIDNLNNVDENLYVHINPCLESYMNGEGLMPSCYHVAKGKNFKKVLELADTWEESLEDVTTSGFGRPVDFKPESKFWFADEEFATQKLAKYENKHELLFLQRQGEPQIHRRVDRGRWKYIPELVENEFYFDSHSIRPYKENKAEIDKLVEHIMSKHGR